jgi:hypothetical protein
MQAYHKWIVEVKSIEYFCSVRVDNNSIFHFSSINFCNSPIYLPSFVGLFVCQVVCHHRAVERLFLVLVITRLLLH